MAAAATNGQAAEGRRGVVQTIEDGLSYGAAHPTPDNRSRPTERRAPRAPSAPAPDTQPALDLAALAERHAHAVTPDALARFAESLGVDADALVRLGIGREGNEWSFPMRAADGGIIGIRLRARNGKQWAVKRSRVGLFIPASIDTTGTLYAAEGASDTAALLTCGLSVVGLSAAGQAVDALASYVATHKPTRVVLMADAHVAGRAGMAKAARAILTAAPDLDVRIIEPPGGAKDARAALVSMTDPATADPGAYPATHVQSGRDVFRGAIERAAESASSVRPEPAAEPDPLDGDPKLVTLADVEPQRVRWLWEGRIPRGRLTLLVGRPGDGKSFATADWAARVSAGQPWPDRPPCERGSVLLVAGEDDPGDTIRPRLDAHGGDVARVHLLQAVHSVTPGGKVGEAVFTLEDIRPLELALERVPDCALVIVDPIGSFIGGRVDAHRDNEVRGVLAPLAALAQRTGTAVVLVAHQRKAAASHADDMVLGSRAFTGIARSVLHLMRDPDNENRRLLLPGKANLSRPALTLAFSIGGDPPALTWEDGPVNLTADGVLAAHQGGGEGGGRTERDDAAEWLQEFLAGGPVLAADVRRESAAAGFSFGTVKRAKAAAEIEAHKSGFDGAWWWSLPGDTRPLGERPEHATPHRPQVIAWTPERFAAEIVAPALSIREDVDARAAAAGMRKGQARSLLNRAVDAGLVHVYAGGRGPHRYSTTQPPELADAALEGVDEGAQPTKGPTEGAHSSGGAPLRAKPEENVGFEPKGRNSEGVSAFGEHLRDGEHLGDAGATALEAAS